MFCCTLLYVHSSFAIILIGKRGLVALLSLCLIIVVWLFLAVPCVCLQFVTVLFPDHTHYFCCVARTIHYAQKRILLFSREPKSYIVQKHILFCT